MITFTPFFFLSHNLLHQMTLPNPAHKRAPLQRACDRGARKNPSSDTDLGTNNPPIQNSEELALMRRTVFVDVTGNRRLAIWLWVTSTVLFSTAKWFDNTLGDVLSSAV